MMAEMNVQIHSDYCTTDQRDIQDILSEITALVSAAVLRVTAEPAEPEEAA